MAVQSRFLLRRRTDRTLVAPLRNAMIEAMSGEDPEWLGVHLEVVHHPHGWSLNETMFDGHYVGLNLSDQVLIIDTCLFDSWAPISLPPKTFWIIPGGNAFSVRNGPRYDMVSAVIDGSFLNTLAGNPYEFQLGHGFSDDLLLHLFQVLAECAMENGKISPRITKASVDSFLLALAQRCGEPAKDAGSAALSPAHLRSLLDWIELNLARSLTIRRMAAQIGLSDAQFHHAFKQATGTSPWVFVIERRLEKAATQLRLGERASAVAESCGFSDQAHLSRLFKRRYGLTPLAYVAKHRGTKNQHDAPG